MRGPRWIPRRRSAAASLLIEKLRRGTRRHRWSEGPIEVRAVRPSQSGAPPLRGLQQRRVRKVNARARLAQLGDDLATIRHQDLFTVPDKAEVLAKPVLEFTHADRLHDTNVAT